MHVLPPLKNVASDLLPAPETSPKLILAGQMEHKQVRVHPCLILYFFILTKVGDLAIVIMNRI